MAEKISQENLDKFIDHELRAWSDYVLKTLRGAIEKNDLVMTRELVSSLRTAISSSGEIKKVSLTFAHHGRYKDLKKMYFKSAPPVEIIKDWVEKIGVEKFKSVPGYKKNTRVPTKSEAATRIAWGIVRSMKGREIKQKTAWYNKNFYGTINNLIERLMTNYQDFARKTIIENLKS